MNEFKTTTKEQERHVYELNRFLELMAFFIHQIDDDVIREGMEGALDRMRIINAK